MWTRGFNLTGRERFAAGRFLARVDANRTLAPGTLESGWRPEQVWTRPMLHFSINAVIYNGDILALSDYIQVSFLVAIWSCQCKHVCQKML